MFRLSAQHQHGAIQTVPGWTGTFAARGGGADVLSKNSYLRVPLLGAVGPLQFEVLQFRLKTEYGADCRLEPANWRVIRWVDPTSVESVSSDLMPTGSILAADEQERVVMLFTDEWACNFFTDRNPKIQLHKLAGNLLTPS